MSNQYYCLKCASELGHSSPEVGNLTGSAYQLNKFVKHTLPEETYNYNSIFDEKDYVSYENYTVNTLNSGSLEIDDQGRKNFVWIADNNVGALYEDGEFEVSNDAIKVVLPYDENKIHSFPTGSAGIKSAECSNCGDPIII